MLRDCASGSEDILQGKQAEAKVGREAENFADPACPAVRAKGPSKWTMFEAQRHSCYSPFHHVLWAGQEVETEVEEPVHSLRPCYKSPPLSVRPLCCKWGVNVPKVDYHGVRSRPLIAQTN